MIGSGHSPTACGAAIHGGTSHGTSRGGTTSWATTHGGRARGDTTRAGTPAVSRAAVIAAAVVALAALAGCGASPLWAEPLFTGVYAPGGDAYVLWASPDWRAFEEKWRQLGGQGLRLVAVRTYRQDGRPAYVGAWREGAGAQELTGPCVRYPVAWAGGRPRLP
jgi:hypothetical protein